MAFVLILRPEVESLFLFLVMKKMLFSFYSKINVFCNNGVIKKLELYGLGIFG